MISTAELELRGYWSNPNGDYPEYLPDSWRSGPESVTITGIQTRTDQELVGIGWSGPIAIPGADMGSEYFQNDYVWDNRNRVFTSTPVSDLTRHQRALFSEFWRDIKASSAWTKIESTSSTLIPSETLAEISFLLAEPSRKADNSDRIQTVIHSVMNSMTFTDEELAEIQEAFDANGLCGVYTLIEETDP